MRTSRCSTKGHVIAKGEPACDCKALMMYPAPKLQALVVTLPTGTVLPVRPYASRGVAG